MIALPIFAFLPTLHLNLGLRITHCLEEVWSLCPSAQRSTHTIHIYTHTHHTTHLHITPSIFSKAQFDKWLILLDEQRAVGGSLSFWLSFCLSYLFSVSPGEEGDEQVVWLMLVLSVTVSDVWPPLTLSYQPCVLTYDTHPYSLMWWTLNPSTLKYAEGCALEHA